MAAGKKASLETPHRCKSTTAEEVKPLTSAVAKDNSSAEGSSNGGNDRDHTNNGNARGFESKERGKPDISSPNVLVLDSAACWIVCAAVSMQYFMNATFRRLLSICFLDFVEGFEASITTTSLGFTFHLISFSMASLVAMNAVVPVTGERIAVVTGGLIGSFCTIGVGLAPNIIVFLLLLSIRGFCEGMTLVPAISLITQYFKKRRSLATALAYCGVGAGNMACPPVIEILLKNFGLPGTFLIIAGAELNAVVIAMLLRPRSRYTHVIESDEDLHELELEVDEAEQEDVNVNQTLLVGEEKENSNSKRNDLTSLSSLENFMNMEKNASMDKSNVKVTTNGHTTNGISKNNDAITNGHTNSKNAINAINGSADKNKQNNTNSDKTPRTITINGGVVPFVPRKRSTSCRDEKENVYQDTTTTISRAIRSNLSLQDANLTRTYKPSSMRDIHGYAAKLFGGSRQNTPKKSGMGNSLSPTLNKEAREMSSTWSVYSAAVHDMALDVQSMVRDNTRDRRIHSLDNGLAEMYNTKPDTIITKDLPETSSSSEEATTCVGKTQSVLERLICKDLLKTWSMKILLISGALGALAQYVVTYLPTLASKQGLDPSQVAVLLTVSGGVDLMSRIGIGFLADLHILTPGQITAITQIILGTVLHFIHMYQTYNTLMFLAVVTGLFASTRQNLSPLITIEFLGLGRFLRALGFQVMVCMLSLAAHHPLLSAILEKTGSFAPPLHYVGITLYMSAAFVLTAPIAKRVDARREEIKNQHLV